MYFVVIRSSKNFGQKNTLENIKSIHFFDMSYVVDGD